MPNTTDDRESEPSRGPMAADLRADYDDEFGRVRSPRQIARRRLLIPALDFLLVGICSAMISLGSAIYVVYDYIGDAADPMDYLELVGLLALCGLGGALSALFLVSGDGMLRLRRHRAALIASYIATSFSLASIYAILFYPFGIWALVLLHKTEIRNEFDRVVDPSERPGFGLGSVFAWFAHIPVGALLIASALGMIVMLMVGGGIAWDAYTDGSSSESEVLGAVGLTFVGAGAFTLLLIRAVRLRRRRR